MPEIIELRTVETTDDKISVIRDELAETKKMVRKLLHESVPQLSKKVFELDTRMSSLEAKLDLIITLLKK